MYEVQNYYDGSRKFTFLANYFGLSVDLAVHIALLPALCYIIIRTQNPMVVQKIVLFVAMFYLLCIHLHRQVYDYGSYALDVTGPLMIITQKVTSLAFSIHDGFTREHNHMTKAQQYHALKKLPSALEFFSYTLHFQGIMAGPMVFYKDYIEFVEGYNLLKQNNANKNSDTSNQREIVLEPSPVKAVIKKLLGSAICAFIFMKFVKEYPIKRISDDDFIENSSAFYKIWFCMMSTTIVRFKYYHAWLLSDAICNNSGLGFTGYEKDGSSKWDLVSNINVLSFEFATNMRDAINNWNIGTNHWLRTIVYERVPKKYGTILTFALSALWHGFYPGYYITFATGALFVVAARTARRLFRHRFQKTVLTRMFYDIVTCLTTRIVMGYTTFPFVLLEFMGSIRLYLNFYMCLHIAAILTIVILPKLIPTRENKTDKITQSNSLSLGVNVDKNVLNKHGNNNIQENTSVGVTVNGLFNSNDINSNGKEAIRIQHDECEMDNLSNKLKEKIEIETRNIEEFLDKTVTGIVEFRDDLMRMSDSEKIYVPSDSNLRKRSNCEKVEGVDAFLKKEICVLNAAVQQANVIPAVLSNTHAK
ncbi:lysophospholipid acyltransferase 6 isoform X2 [Condylostylus longicornis]|uniref:lysophospholipid acyltransferase 6 isoform X2 n=1 Tax=Condylostylus longicornis TaxID=2530218 RepID=UPI00244E2191|nr:lysophospholipid acyltransferase 6 isoform X2 [Condylostylus longicornis]